MRILLAANASYDPPRGGSTRSNLCWLRQLAAAGHDCSIVSLSEDGGPPEVTRDGIVIHRIPDLTRNAGAVRELIEGKRPGWVLLSSEDLTHRLLREAAAAAPGRVIYLAHTPQFFPFGPESWHRDPAAAELVRRARAVITISESVSAYVREHLGVDSKTSHPPVYGPGPYPDLSDFDRRAALLMNPCDVKGLPVFLGLADRLPEFRFVALSGWGTGMRDREAMASRPNVRLLEPVARIEEALSLASAVLMPSLWLEGFGLAATEAMLRGLPVLAADHGGLREAMADTGGLLPVRPITGYRAEFDDRRMPLAQVPPQDIDPWEVSLRRLFTDRGAYEIASRQCRASAFATVAQVPPDGILGILGALTPSPALSPSQRRLLEARLAEKRKAAAEKPASDSK
jgi:glycosyltransferase involved in cell wall biosynthesis